MSSSPDGTGPAGSDGPGRPEPTGRPAAQPAGHPAQQPAAQPVCPRHPGRVSYVRCQRCERPVCPDCQRPAAVGVHCVDCVRAQPAVRARTVAGAPLGQGRPVVTQAFIAVLAIVWVGQQLLPLTGWLAFSPVLSLAQPWRFLTHGLVHSPGLPLHLLLNGFALWVVGRELEPVLGRWRYLSLLLLSTLAAAVGVLWLTPASVLFDSAWSGFTVGASGAVFGLLGCGVVLNGRRGEHVGRQVLVLLALAAVGFVLPSISWQGHLGGLVGGLLVGAVLLLAPRTHRTRVQVLGLLGVLALLVGLTVLRWVVVGPQALVPFGG